MAATPETEERTSGTTTASPIDQHSAPVRDRRGHSGKATAALVLGIVGVPLAFVIPIVGLILGILAIIFGAIGRSEARRGAGNTGQALAGIILGSIDIVLFFLGLAFWASQANS